MCHAQLEAGERALGEAQAALQKVRIGVAARVGG
jgi:hypothetical protein